MANEGAERLRRPHIQYIMFHCSVLSSHEDMLMSRCRPILGFATEEKTDPPNYSANSKEMGSVVSEIVALSWLDIVEV